MLKRVTFTGIDNKTKIEDLMLLKTTYPFIEFGILVSTKLSNKNTNNRYPHLTLLKRLKVQGLNLSCHVCGSAARKIVLENDWSEFEKLVGRDLDLFDRIQLNVSNLKNFHQDISFLTDKEFIIQQGKDFSLYEYYKHLPNVVGFQDNSGGLGKYNGNWIETDCYFGYAGGININNVEEVISDLLIFNNSDFWIDMESSVRSNDWFDIQKCKEICESINNLI